MGRATGGTTWLIYYRSREVILPTHAGRGRGAPARRIGLDAEPVHGVSKLLFAPKVALSRLDRDVPEEELDLVQFAAGQVAQACACPTQIVWRQLGDIRLGGRVSDDVPLPGFRPGR